LAQSSNIVYDGADLDPARGLRLAHDVISSSLPCNTRPNQSGKAINAESQTYRTRRITGLTSRILTCTELKGHCFVLVSGYVC